MKTTTQFLIMVTIVIIGSGIDSIVDIALKAIGF